MRFLLGLLYYFLHALLWVVVIVGCIGVLLLCIAAYGIPGRWVNSYIDAYIPNTSLDLSVERISYIPLRGLQITNLKLKNAEARTLVSFSKGIIGFELLTAKAWEKRLTDLTFEDLFVAQIEHTPPPAESSSSLPPPEARPPFPDLSTVKIPQFDDVNLHLLRPDVLEVRLEDVVGKLSVKGGTVFFTDLNGTIGHGDQTAEADLEVNVHGGIVKAHIRGFLFQTRLNGIWRALDFPVIEKYSDYFTLKTPAWADCSFTVGFDKYRNIFRLIVDIAAKEGAYCGVAFDEAIGTIVCQGIWDAVTTISPLIARRKGEVVAQGKLIFDTVQDKFIFQAESTGLQAREALQLINMPFTDVIPEIKGTRPPHISIQGEIPLLSEQTPDKVSLSAEISLPNGGELYGIPVKTAQTELAMNNGALSLNNFVATFSNQGKLRGDALFKIPNEAEYTDLSTLFYLEKTPLSVLLTPLHVKSTPENATLTGFVDLSGRTDETFANTLNSRYSLTLEGGIITRIPIFAGLTNLIADNIPGISSITDSSTAKLIGTAEHGFFNVPDFTLTGDLLSIEGPITYDLPNDFLLAQITAGNFKHGSMLGYLTRWVTVPLNKLMWQVKVAGPIGNPEWEIVTILEGLWHKAWGKDPFDSTPHNPND